MKPATVWLNKNLSSTFDVVEILRETRKPGEFRILTTHPDPEAPVSRVGDLFEVEPKGWSEAAYVDYCLGFAVRNKVDLFLPGKNLLAITRAEERFAAIGVRLLVAGSPETLTIVENKASFYANLDATVAAIPEHEVVRDLAGFDRAYARLKERFGRVCFKPAVSMFGLGFRILVDESNPLKRLFNGDTLHLGLDEARRILGETESFRELLVMRYLSGVERSVDALAHDGALVRCVIRRKSTTSEGPQLLEANAEVEAAVSRLVRHFGLRGLFNVQFREADGVPYLLEINPRMSGGIFYTSLSGLILPLWAIRLALGTATPGEVPEPTTGLRVCKVNRAFRL